MSARTLGATAVFLRLPPLPRARPSWTVLRPACNEGSPNTRAGRVAPDPREAERGGGQGCWKASGTAPHGFSVGELLGAWPRALRKGTETETGTERGKEVLRQKRDNKKEREGERETERET